MNKKGVTWGFETILKLVIALIVIVAIIIFSRNSLSELIDFFMNLIKGIK